MPNLGVVLKQEIARLARREARPMTEPVRKAVAQHRRTIASLKEQVAKLERQVALLQRQRLGATPAASSAPSGGKLRFRAGGLKAHRSRLGLSAADYGKLVGVTAQSVYNWERGDAAPRGEQLARVAALRSIGKREAAARLIQVAPKATKPRRRAKR